MVVGDDEESTSTPPLFQDSMGFDAHIDFQVLAASPILSWMVVGIRLLFDILLVGLSGGITTSLSKSRIARGTYPKNKHLSTLTPQA